MTITHAEPYILTPTGDRSPVEKAVVTGMLDDFEPETFLWIVFHRPDGGANLWHAWTTGGPQLGDQTDQAALAAGMDAADWFAITSRHFTQHTRGRIETTAHPLRPILADIKAGHGDDGDYRDKLSRLPAIYAKQSGQALPHPERMARWMGVGPTLVNRNR